MTDPTFTINVEKGQNHVEIIHRTGSAIPVLPPKPPIKQEISGVIGVPFEFLIRRMMEEDQIDLKKCHLIVDREKLTITLITHEDDEYKRCVITGKLEQHPLFKELRINDSPYSWEPFKLGQLLRLRRAYFPSKEENMKLVFELKNFNARINSTIERSRSESGSSKDLFEQVVDTNIPESFRLKIPVFKGVPAEVIDVEFDHQVADRIVSMRLVSPGAEEIRANIENTIIDEEIKNFRSATDEQLAIFEV